MPQRAVARLVLGTDYVQLTSGDVVAQISNASFDAATFEIWGALLNGARLVIIPTETALSPRGLAEALQRSGVTALFLTTALFQHIAREHPSAFAGTSRAVWWRRRRSARRGFGASERRPAGTLAARLRPDGKHDLCHLVPGGTDRSGCHDHPDRQADRVFADCKIPFPSA